MAEKLALTREEYKKIRNEEQLKESEKEQTVKQPEARSIPIWLRLVILLVLTIICLSAGAVVGYSGLGHGSAIDVFKESTWGHIYDLIEKNN